MSAEADSLEIMTPAAWIAAEGGNSSMPYWRLHYHLVWATQHREPLIDEETRTIVERSLRLSIDDLGLICHAIGFMPDHLHVAASIPPRHAVAEVLKRLKGTSSHAVRATNPVFAW